VSRFAGYGREVRKKFPEAESPDPTESAQFVAGIELSIAGMPPERNTKLQANEVSGAIWTSRKRAPRNSSPESFTLRRQLAGVESFFTQAAT
jgi:hypothetical protein